MSKIASYTDELVAELDAFDRDLVKLSHRLAEIGREGIFEPDNYKFKQRVALAKEHVDSAWRSMQYARLATTE